MNRRYLGSLCPIVLVIGIAWPAVGQVESVTPPAAPDEGGKPPSQPVSDGDSKEISRLIAQYRLPRLTPEHKAAIVAKMVALGPNGVKAARSLIEKELALTAPLPAAAQKPAALENKISKLRQVLADLRNDPDLSHDQLVKVGLPALDQLTALYRQHAPKAAARAAKDAKAASQVRQVIAVLESLQQQWALDAPIPLQEMLGTAQQQLSGLSSPEEVETRKVNSENAALAKRLDSNAVKGMEAVNAMRAMCGLRTLAYDPKLCRAARGHSSDMQSRDFFAHESPVSGKKTPWDRAQLAGTTASGENIYMGSAVTMDAIKAWFLSPPHHKNMLNEKNTRQGLGHEGKYWTQMFGQ